MSTWKVQAIGAAAMILFLYFTVLGVLSHQWGAAAGLLVFVLLGVPTLSCSGPISLQTEILSIATLAGRFQIALRDVERIEHGASYWVFFAGPKRLSVPAPFTWSGRDKAALIAILDSIVQERKIDFTSTRRADSLFSKNTRAV